VEILKMGADPDLRVQEERERWRRRVKHRRCGTRVELTAADVDSAVSRSWAGGFSFNWAEWTCPCCGVSVPLSRRQFPTRFRDRVNA
jgi:hypothetical protein